MHELAPQEWHEKLKSKKLENMKASDADEETDTEEVKMDTTLRIWHIHRLYNTANSLGLRLMLVEFGAKTTLPIPFSLLSSILIMIA